MSDDNVTKALVTSEQLSRGALAACWSVALLLLVGGLAATFMDKPGAAAATMIALGAVFLLLALMGRIPLRIEVAGTKLDASYPPDQAFDAGRQGGMRQGLEVALEEVKEAADVTEVQDDLLKLLALYNTRLYEPADWGITREREEDLFDLPSETKATAAGGLAYSQVSAARAAGITMRQIDYWQRTALVEPTGTLRDGTVAYTLRDVVVLLVVKRLLDTGVSLQQIRGAAAAIRSRSLDDLANVTLMSDGRSVYETTSPAEIIDLLQSGEGMFGVAIGKILRDASAALRREPGEPLT